MKTAAQAAAAWATNTAAAGQALTDGVNSVTVAPGAAAARQSAAYLAGVQAGVGKWQKNVQAVTLQDWQQAMITKGVPRIQQGVTSAQPKMEAFMTKFLPVVAAAKAALPPRGGLEQNLQRANAMARALSKFSNT